MICVVEHRVNELIQSLPCRSNAPGDPWTGEPEISPLLETKRGTAGEKITENSRYTSVAGCLVHSERKSLEYSTCLGSSKIYLVALNWE